MTEREAEEFIRAHEEIVTIGYEHYKRMYETLNWAKAMLLSNKWPTNEPSKDN